MVSKPKQIIKRNFKSYRKRNKEVNTLIEKKFQKFVKKKKRRKAERELQHFQKLKMSENESKKSVPSLAESIESGEILSFSSK